MGGRSQADSRNLSRTQAERASGYSTWTRPPSNLYHHIFLLLSINNSGGDENLFGEKSLNGDNGGDGGDNAGDNQWW